MDGRLLLARRPGRVRADRASRCRWSGSPATTSAAAWSTPGQPIDLLATATAAESTYAGVVRLVEQAQASSAPFVRVADRFAILFVPLTLVVAGAGVGAER